MSDYLYENVVYEIGLFFDAFLYLSLVIVIMFSNYKTYIYIYIYILHRYIYTYIYIYIEKVRNRKGITLKRENLEKDNSERKI